MTNKQDELLQEIITVHDANVKLSDHLLKEYGESVGESTDLLLSRIKIVLGINR